MFVVVSTACNSCDEEAVCILEKEPTREDIRKVEMFIGDMLCIVSTVYEVNSFEHIVARPHS